jgi:phosphopantetheinyl transferase (holo-ACP synthase)
MATVVQNPDETFTLTLTAREHAVAQRWAAKQGVSKANGIEALIERKLRELYLQYKDREAAARQEAYEAAGAQTKTAVDTALGFVAPTD